MDLPGDMRKSIWRFEPTHITLLENNAYQQSYTQGEHLSLIFFKDCPAAITPSL